MKKMSDVDEAGCSCIQNILRENISCFQAFLKVITADLTHFPLFQLSIWEIKSIYLYYILPGR